MRKVYVLDTNVLLHDPNALFAFKENEVVIPAIVLEEIDSKKRNADELGRNARQVARTLDGLREHGQLHQGIELENGGRLTVEMGSATDASIQETFGEVTNDNRILGTALTYKINQALQETQKPVILVSKDVLIRVKSDVLGIEAQDYMNDRTVNLPELYTGYTRLSIPSELIGKFYQNKMLPIQELQAYASFYPNQYLILKDDTGSNQSALVWVNPVSQRIEPLYYGQSTVWGIQARNAQQRMALDLLLNDNIPLVTITGKAGTGKTLLALAAGLSKVEDEQLYKKLLIARPVVPLGNDIGFLPGEKEEKLRPWMQPVYDNLEYLFDTKKSGDLDKILLGLTNIQVEALTYIRGRSIPSQFIIIDEAQNLSRHEVKTIVSRAGEGSKIVLMGDPEQIDHPYLDAESNGLTYVLERFKDQNISGHITLEKGERSLLAQLAADLL